MSLDFTDVTTPETMAEGEYEVSCVKAKMVETKKGGKSIVLTFQTRDGMQFDNWFTYQNPPGYVVADPAKDPAKIGKNSIIKFADASGKKDPKTLREFDELIGLTCLAKIKVKEDDFGKKPSITSFKSLPKEHKSADPFA